MTTTHFTAWITTDPTSLAGTTCDVVVLRDEPTSYRTDGDGNETPVWGSTGDSLFVAETTVDARSGEHAIAQAEAEGLLAAAGWRMLGSWEAVTSGYVVEVEQA